MYSNRIHGVKSFLEKLSTLLYKQNVSLEAAIPVRFARDMKARLQSVSDKTGVPLAQLVRIATEQYLDQVEKARSLVIPYVLQDGASSSPEAAAKDGAKKAVASVEKGVVVYGRKRRAASTSGKTS